MPIINVQIRRRKANNPVAEIVCGNSDYQIAFNFDSEWDAHPTKTARFIWNGQYQDVIFTGNVCKAPVITNATLCAVGVYAGDLHTTTPALIVCKKSILCGGGLPADPAPDVYAKIMEELNIAQARINTIVTLPEGSTTSDAEVADIRVGHDGTPYGSAGEAVRGQIKHLSREKLDKEETHKYAYAIADAKGRAVFVIDNNGNVIFNQKNIVADSRAIYHTADDGAKAEEYRNDGRFDFAVTDKDGKILFYVDNGVLRVNTINVDTVINGAFNTTVQTVNRMYSGQFTGNYDAEINMFICYGQSWAGGYDAQAITKTQRYDNLMLNTGVRNEPLDNMDAVATSFVPAVEVDGKSSAGGQLVGETPVSAQMNMVKQLMEEEDGLDVEALSYQLLGISPGFGSKSLAELSKGTIYYDRLISQVQMAYDIATAMGKRLVVQAFSWAQGAIGSGLTGTYAENLELLRQNIDTDVKAITGQAQDVKCITWQSFLYTANAAKDAYNKYVGASEIFPHIVCSGATYHLDNVAANNLHFTAESQDWLGAYFGIAYKRTVIDGSDFEPTKPTKATRTGKILYLKFNVPHRPLVIDTDRVAEAPNYGFNLYNEAGTEKTISGVSVIAPDTVKILCTENVLSTDRLTYGQNAGAVYGRTTGNRGNIRDSQGDFIVYTSGAGSKLPMHNWCVIFDKTINELEGN